jgi:hypothetical protein
MKKLITIFAAVSVSVSTFAQEIAPIEKAREIVRLIDAQFGKLPDAPFTVELDLDQPQILVKEPHIGIAIPAKGLNAKTISNAGKVVVPIGMLWFKDLLPADGAIVAPTEETARSVQLVTDKKKVTVHPFFAKVRKNAGGRLELVLYGKSSQEPYLTSRLLPMPSRQDMPIELAAYGGDDTGAILMLSFAGKYQSEIKIVPQESQEEYVSSGKGEGTGSKADKVVRILSQHLNKFKAGHVKIDGNLGQADMFERNDVAALIIPDKGLTAEKLAKIGKKEIPVGQLWLKSLMPEVGGSSPADSDLKLVEVSDGDKSMELPQFLLTARRIGKKLNLIVYSGAADPLMELPLEQFETGQSLPIELEGEARDNSSGLLSLYVMGKYHAKMIVIPR